jgi:hypothetical protein
VNLSSAELFPEHFSEKESLDILMEGGAVAMSQTKRPQLLKKYYIL